MPTLPLPQVPSIVPGGGDLIVTSSADVLAAMPAFVQYAQGAQAPVRDGIAAGIAGVHLRYQQESAYAAAQCDVLRATDFYLTGLAEDRGIFPQPGEDQEAFRARILAVPQQVTPAAIVTVANAVLSLYTTVQAQYFESILDRLYLTDGTLPWHSFIGTVTPEYQDRYYRDDAAQNGMFVPNRESGGSWVFSDMIGRFFILRVPVVADTALSLAYAGFDDTTGLPILLSNTDTLPPELGGAQAGAIETNGTIIVEPPLSPGVFPTTAGGTGLFLADGSNTSGAEADGSVATFFYNGATTASAIYQAIVNAVDRIHGQSVRWELYVDQFLVN